MHIVMRYIIHTSVLLILFLLTQACEPGSKPSAVLDDRGNLVLNVPSVPDQLSDSLERANYRVTHYWDYMDFEIDSLTSARSFMERSIKDYIRLFPMADTAVVRSSVQSVIARAEADTLAYSFFLNVPERYLLDEEPSMQEYYVYFADAFISSAFLPDEYKERPRFLRQVALMNRVGTQATDLPYMTAAGDSARLSDLRGTPVILYMYNTGCSMCLTEAEYLGQSSVLTDLISVGKLAVLAVSRTGDKDKWLSVAQRMPSGWIHGSAVRELTDLDLYAVLHVPTIYLIDAYGNVVLKDVDTTDLILWLDEHELPAVPRPIHIS